MSCLVFWGLGLVVGADATTVCVCAHRYIYGLYAGPLPGCTELPSLRLLLHMGLQILPPMVLEIPGLFSSSYKYTDMDYP